MTGLLLVISQWPPKVPTMSASMEIIELVTDRLVTATLDWMDKYNSQWNKKAPFVS